MRATLLGLVCLAAVSVHAQTRGDCAPGTARGELNDGDVRAGLYPNGNLFFGSAIDAASYVVPAAGGKSPIYAAALWVGGTVGGEIRVAGASYSDFSFRPGPLGADGTVPHPTDCSAWDRVFVVSADDIAAYEAGGAPTADLAAWPVAWGAEAVDGDGDPTNYSLAGGDRPRLYGTQTAFWVMNDLAGPSPQGHPPIGLEVQVTAAAFDTADLAFAQATVYRFRLIKRTPGTMPDARVGLWADPDLGFAGDDFVGTDAARGLYFAYNADEIDDTTDPNGYGSPPPAVGFDWLSGAGNSMMVLKWGQGPYEPPVLAPEIHHSLHSRWNDGTPLREGGYGFLPTGAPVTWAFPGDPVTDQFWSEENAYETGEALFGEDMRLLLVAAETALVPGRPVDVVLSVPFARGADRLDSVTQLRAASDAIQAAYDTRLLFPVAGETPAAPAARGLALSPPRPNPTGGAAEMTVTLPAAGAARVVVLDVLGREVAVVHEGALAAGPTALRLPAGLAPGVYAVVAEGAGTRVTQRLTVVH